MTSAPVPRSFYDLLGVHPHSSAQIIREAWRAQVMRAHPDHAPKDRLRSEFQLRELNRAYAILKNPQTRAAYDAFLGRKTSDAPTTSVLRHNRPVVATFRSRWRRACALACEILWPLVRAEARHGR